MIDCANVRDPTPSHMIRDGAIVQVQSNRPRVIRVGRIVRFCFSVGCECDRNLSAYILVLQLHLSLTAYLVRLNGRPATCRFGGVVNVRNYVLVEHMFYCCVG